MKPGRPRKPELYVCPKCGNYKTPQAKQCQQCYLRPRQNGGRANTERMLAIGRMFYLQGAGLDTLREQFPNVKDIPRELERYRAWLDQNGDDHDEPESDVLPCRRSKARWPICSHGHECAALSGSGQCAAHDAFLRKYNVNGNGRHPQFGHAHGMHPALKSKKLVGVR